MYRMLVTSDWHCGSAVGLTPPECQNDDNRSYLGPLWTFFERAVEQIGTVDCHVANGDLIDGKQRKDSSALLVTNLNKQVDMATRVAEMVKAKRTVIIRGTGYHTDDQCSYEQFVAEQLCTEALDEWRCSVHGVRCHFRHVVGRSDIPYGQYTQVGKELTNEILQAEIEGGESPHLLGRAHVHYCVKVGQVGPDGAWREAWTNPALQLRGPGQTAFTRKLRTWLYHVGVTLVEIEEGGGFYIRPIIFPLHRYMRREYECLTHELI